MLKRGRPKKEIDAGIIFHMLKNNAPIVKVAKYLGVHRDTIYANHRDMIEEARRAGHEESMKYASKGV